MELFLVNTSRGLVPYADEDYEKKSKLKLGQLYRVNVSEPRNPGLHRKYFALIRCSWDLLPPEVRAEYGESYGMDNENALDGYRRDLQMEAGYYDIMYCSAVKGKIKVPQSISYNNLSGVKFTALYEAVRAVIFNKFLSHITMEQFEEQLINY